MWVFLFVAPANHSRYPNASGYVSADDVFDEKLISLAPKQSFPAAILDAKSEKSPRTASGVAS